MKQINILIVEDSLIVRARIITQLTKCDRVKVIGQVGSVTTSLDILMKITPDVVILDIQLPDGSGIDTLKAIKRKDRNIIVIVLTNHNFPFIKRIFMKEGADYFFDKSTEFEQITELLKNF